MLANSLEKIGQQITNRSPRRKLLQAHLVLIEDDRLDYGEQRMIGIGLLKSWVVSIVHVESPTNIRINSHHLDAQSRQQ